MKSYTFHRLTKCLTVHHNPNVTQDSVQNKRIINTSDKYDKTVSFLEKLEGLSCFM